MRRLTEAQRRVLGYIVNDEKFRSIPFRTAEVLRRRGLVTRETIHVVKRVYADETGEFLQFEVPPDQFVTWHDWFPTTAGRAALNKEGRDGNR